LRTDAISTSFPRKIATGRTYYQKEDKECKIKITPEWFQDGEMGTREQIVSSIR
jgi:hypothetical protein